MRILDLTVQKWYNKNVRYQGRLTYLERVEEIIDEENTVTPTPRIVSTGTALGALAALLFLIADLYVILHMVHTIVAPKSNWKWLQNMGKRWHPIHYYGNMALVVVMIIHASILAPYTGFWNWLFLAFILWMGFAGMMLKFSHISPKAKATLARFHARWYMILLALILLIVAHLTSLPNFPFRLG